MPTRQQIADADPLDADGAAFLLSYLRASETYKALPGVFSTLETDLAALVGSTAVKSRQLTAIADALEELGPDGTVGVKGGRYGADYSLPRDREQLLDLALNVLYDTGLYAGGISQYAAASAQMYDPDCKVRYICCSHCGGHWYGSGSLCAGCSGFFAWFA